MTLSKMDLENATIDEINVELLNARQRLMDGDLDAVAELASFRSRRPRSVSVYNDNADYDLAGAFVDWDGRTAHRKVGPGESRRFDKISFMLLSLIDTDDGVTRITLTNEVHLSALYDVTRMTGDINHAEQFLNPQEGARESYDLRWDERLMITPKDLPAFASLHESGSETVSA